MVSCATPRKEGKLGKDRERRTDELGGKELRKPGVQMGHGRLVSEILNLWKAVSFIGRRRGLKACPVTVVKSWVGGGRGK